VSVLQEPVAPPDAGLNTLVIRSEFDSFKVVNHPHSI
jgi:hypothetical protein